MSRRKQPNPAKLEETEIPNTDHTYKTNSNTAQSQVKEEEEADGNFQRNNFESSTDNNDENYVKVEPFDQEDHEDSLGSVGTNQASWDSNTPEQASPASSSCPTPSSIVSDVTDAEVFTVGVTETTPYACKICNKAFAKTSQLTRHEQTHSDHLQYNCIYCPRLFKHKRSRDRHIKLHTGDKKYKCSFCDTAFSRSDHLKIHLKTHDNSKPFKCFLCNRGYNTAAALTSHQQSHIKQDKDNKDHNNSSESHACSYCSETFQKLELLQAHTSSHHLEPLTEEGNGDGTKWLCMYCTKDFLSLDELQQHVNNSHDVVTDSKSDDSSCKSSINNSSQIINQVQRVSYPCYNCTMQFYCLEKLRDHMARVHWGATTQQKLLSNAVLKDCNICLPISQNCSAPPPSLTQTSTDHSIQLLPTDLSWKRKAELSDENEHSTKRFLQKTDVVEGCDNDKCEWPIYICNICGTQLPNFSSFMLHMDNHIPGTDRNSTIFLDYCPLCGEPCRDQVEVNNHILVHAISLKLGKCCSICKKVFNYNSDELQRHMVDVHVSTTYKCSICEDTFDIKSEVLIHMTKKHSNECQHYRCKFCPDQTFHDRVDAEVHISQHSPQLLNTLCRNTNRLIYPSINNSNSGGLLQQKKSKTFQCPFCHKCFQTEQHQYLHIIREHKDIRDMYRKRVLEINPDAQRQLQSTSPSISSLNSVPNADLSNKYEVNHDRYKCDICDCKDFVNESDFLAHKKLHQSKSKAISVSLHCAYCNELCKSRTDLENHTKSHQINSAKGKHKCNICDEIFQSGMTLAEHKLSHCKIVSGNSCTHCRTVLSDEQTFYNHQLQHSTVLNKQNSQMSLPANCIICCQTLQSEVEIKLHANFHLRHLLNKDLICSICKNSYDSTNGPLISTANSDNTILYICKECFSKNGTSSTSNSPLYPIIKYETDDKVTTCPHCHQVFQTEEKAMKHLASHGVFDTGSSYVCHLCRSFFPTPLKLQVHVIEHNFFGSGQFRCYICSTIFTTASGLLSHMLKHGSNAKPYECSQCQMKFFFQTELDNHRDDHLASIHHKGYQTVTFSPNSSEANDLVPNKQQHCQCYEYPWSPSASEKHLQHCPLKVTIKKELRSSVSPKNEFNLKKEDGDACTSTPSDVER